jgi:hypothetical protein
VPCSQIPDDDSGQAPDNEHHDAEMQKEHCIRKALVKKRTVHCNA